MLEENEENNNQDNGNSDNAGNTEISSQDQTLEKRKSNSRNIIVPILLGVVLFVVALLLKKRVNSDTIKEQIVNNVNGNEQFERVNSDTIKEQVVNSSSDNGNELFRKGENIGVGKKDNDFFLFEENWVESLGFDEK